MIELEDGAGLARLKRKATGPTPDRKRSNETSYGRSNLVSFKKASVNEKRKHRLTLVASRKIQVPPERNVATCTRLPLNWLESRVV
jgi:hypothetical protein